MTRPGTTATCGPRSWTRTPSRPSGSGATSFDPATARSLRQHILEKGGSEDALELYRRFRGRDPGVGPLLRKRGLD